MPEPDSQGSPQDPREGLPAAPGPARPGGCLRACVVLLGLGFMASMALIIVIIWCQDHLVGYFVNNQVEAFRLALDQTQLTEAERKHGKDVATELGKMITNGKIPPDQNLDPWPKIEKILSDFRADTGGGQKTLSPMRAREYIYRMEEVRDELQERETQQPPRPQ